MTLPDPLVLIVDDDGRNRKLARDVLRLAGFETVEAATGTEAIERAIETLPDVILMDLRLPDMHGSEAARRLKEDTRTASIPVVAVSSIGPVGAGSWLLGAGFDGELEKPIDIVSLPEQVRSFL